MKRMRNSLLRGACALALLAGLSLCAGCGGEEKKTEAKTPAAEAAKTEAQQQQQTGPKRPSGPGGGQRPGGPPQR